VPSGPGRLRLCAASVAEAEMQDLHCRMQKLPRLAGTDQAESRASGLRTRTPRGGSVRFSEYGLPCRGRGTASTRPLLPWPLPP